MGYLERLRDIDNLRLAWRWIKSNPDANFKSYFRPLYQRFTIAEDAIIKDLSNRLKRDIYDPEPACKIFHPKSSGILRPYSLLCVEDQIVYQAAINLIAEKLYPRVHHRYFKQVFGHLYAGKSSIWFYRKWSDGYKAFNNAARQAYKDGMIYTASFDLTACYDSLDHCVLRHFLSKLGIDDEFSRKLTSWLAKWTATEKNIFHNHGIPQGPLSSGLLSEVVLSHFDEVKLKNVKIHYFRYVDDIRLFARSEHDLRHLLVSLDLLSKDVGLFPQSGKISIHHIKNIEEELKSVSNPPEASVKRTYIDQIKLFNRIKELTPRYKIQNPTRFKYLLAHANPSAKLTARLWRILDNHPELYRNVCNYLRRYPKFPRVPAKKLIELIKTSNLYQSVRAEFIKTSDGRMPKDQDLDLAKLLKTSWCPRSMHPDSQVAIGRFLIRTEKLSAKQISYACKTAPSWWVRTMLIDNLDNTMLETVAIHNVIDCGIQDDAKDVAIAVAWKAFKLNYMPKIHRKRWNKAAELLLRELGLVKRSVVKRCGISNSFAKMDNRIPSLNWKSLFKARYLHAERQAVETVAASSVSVTNFVNLLDVFNDLLLDAIFKADNKIGRYTLGNIGSALAPASRFAKNYPKTFELANEVHNARYTSMASHPLVKRSGKPTKKISYRFLSKAKLMINEAFHELQKAGIA